MYCKQSKPCELIAAFDLDHTLLKPQKGVFPKNKDDAILAFPNISNKFKQLLADGYKIVIFTNQKGIGKHISIEDVYYKIAKFIPFGEAIDVYVSFKSDCHRKPLPGMFDKFMEHNIAVTDIFYVGDAAGRPNDFNSSDLQFAYNCGINFYTPEEFFCNEPVIERLPRLIKPPELIHIHHNILKRTVIILIGPPGSGKSTLAKNLCKNHSDAVIINNDTTGSSSKSLTLFKKELANNTNYIIIDNTNPSLINRVPFIELAKNNGYRTHAIKMGVTIEIAKHLNLYRAYTQKRDAVPNIAYSAYSSRLKNITDTEGFDSIDTFIPKFSGKIFDYSLV